MELRVGKQKFIQQGGGSLYLTVGKRKSYVVSAERWRIASGAEIEPGESVTIAVGH
jgi:hypothetical protein